MTCKTILLATLISGACSLHGVAVAQEHAARSAQRPAGMHLMLARFGGSAEAMAKTCGGYTEAQLQSMKQQQQASFLKSGGSAAEFQTAFNAGLVEAKARIAQMSPEKIATGCKKLKSDMERMAAAANAMP